MMKIERKGRIRCLDKSCCANYIREWSYECLP